MPLDYRAYQQQVSRPLEKAMQGYQLGTAIRRGQEEEEIRNIKRAQIEQQQQQTKQMQSDLYQLAENQQAGAQDYNRLMLKYPSISDHLKKSFDVLNEGQKLSKQKQALSVFSALEVGDTESAKSMLTQQKEAATEAGMQDEANAADAMLKIMEQNPGSAKVASGLALASSMGMEKFAETYGKIRTEQRKQELQPEKIEKVKQNLKAMKTGEIPKDPEKLLKAETDLRNEYNKSTGEFQKVQDSFRRIEAVGETAAGDLALIFNYMKMLDPGSVVRESEFATAQNAGGVDDKTRNLWNRLLTGERLAPNQRKDFKGQAKKLYGSMNLREKSVRSKLTKIAKQYGLNEENIFYSLPDEEDPEGLEKFTEPEPAPTPPGLPGPVVPEEKEIPADIKALIGI